MLDKKELDATVLDMVGRGVQTAGTLLERIRHDCPLFTDVINHRILDKSIQRLRKEKKIKFEDRKWSLVVRGAMSATSLRVMESRPDGTNN